MIKGYKAGSDITILDAKYCYPRKQEDGSYSDDFMTILFKDNVRGVKDRRVIKKPDYIFYKTDDDVVLDHNLFFIEESKVNPVRVEYRSLLKEIAKETGNEEAFYNNIQSGNRRANENLHMINSIFNSDMNIEDHYRFRFDMMYKNEGFTPTKAYLDIETDNKYAAGDFPELGECPINAVSLIDVANHTIHIFCLENDEYEGLPEFKDGLRNGSIFKELKAFIRNHMGVDKKSGQERFFMYGIDKMEFKFHFYDSLKEIDMIRDIFIVINTSKPDFLMSWNMPFDIPYIIERVITLGYDPLDILCPSSIPREERYCDYWIDVRNKQVPGQRGDSFSIAGWTIYLDQLVEFASRRKGQSAFDNMKLDNIGNIITGVGKLNMYEHANNFADFPRRAYKWFIFYNIMDTIVQHCIEFKVGDIDFVFNKALINNTRFSKAHKQTVYLTNRGIKEFRKEGFIMGNNCNKNNPKPPKFPGALVGNPLNNNTFSKIKLDGFPINMCANLDDYDFKSLYPSTMREFNIAPNTQIGKVIIDHQVHPKENPFDYKRYERGGQFLEDFQCDSYIEFCSRWFHLGGYMEVLEDMKEYLADKPYLGFIQPRDSLVIDLVKYKPKDKLISLVSANTLGRVIPLVTYGRTTNNTIPEVLNDIKKTAQMDIYDYEAIKRRRKSQEDDEKMEEMIEMEDE